MEGIAGIWWAEVSTERLLEIVGDTGVPMYDAVFAHHVTLAYNAGPDWPLLAHRRGDHIPVALAALCWNADIQAITVRLPADLPCQNTGPHITISARPGIPPVASNVMLTGRHVSRVLQPVFIDAVIAWSPTVHLGRLASGEHVLAASGSTATDAALALLPAALSATAASASDQAHRRRVAGSAVRFTLSAPAQPGEPYLVRCCEGEDSGGALS